MQKQEEIDYLRAASPEITEAELVQLANHQACRVRARLAENPITPIEILWNLAADEEPEVRQGLTARPEIPLTILDYLLGDSSPEVRFELAENPHIPTPYLEALACDQNPFVAHRAKRTLASKKLWFRAATSEVAAKHMVKIYTGDTILGEETLARVSACLGDSENCELVRLDIHNPEYLKEARKLGINAVPAIVIDDHLACVGVPSRSDLCEIGLSSLNERKVG